MKKIILGFILVFSFVFIQGSVFAQENLGEKLSGRILLQIENYGEAWYVNPQDQKRYFLNRPLDAFNLMRVLGVGISNKNLNKIPVGFLEGNDTDGDGLNNNLEDALKTDPLNLDTDKDGYNDQEEIINNYNPRGTGTIEIDKEFILKNLGKIFLQVEQNGEAWYIDPIEEKRYFLGRPSDAFTLMRKKALGITNTNLNKISSALVNTKPDTFDKIPENDFPNSEDENNYENKNNNNENIILRAGEAIRNNNKQEVIKCFIPEMAKALEYTLDFLDAEGRFNLGNILSGAKLSESTENKKTYSTEVYFSLGGYKVPINFYVEKQEDGEWLLTNL
jgi:hypothetical protein